MNHLPPTGYLRLKQILGNQKTNPPIQPIIPIGKTSWWQGIREGKFPKPIKLGPRITVWRIEDIRALCDSINGRSTLANGSVKK